MKKVKKTIGLMTIILLFLLIPLSSFSEERDIHIGDLLQLKISTTAFSEEEIRDTFSEFEIVALEVVPEGYLVTLRTFDAGEKTVRLGDKEMVINVKSTLEGTEREAVFEGELIPEVAGFSLEWKYVFFICASVFAISGGLLLVQTLKKRKEALLTPYQRFLKQVKGVRTSEELYLVHLTRCLKDYLEGKFSLHIRGKTSGEILQEIGNVTVLQETLSDVQAWLQESDFFKFSGASASEERKQDFMRRLLELADKMEKINEGKV